MLAKPLFASSICSGFWGCLPLTLSVLAVTVVPIGMGILGLSSVIYYSIRRRWPKGKRLVLMAILSLIAGYFVYFTYLNKNSTAKYQRNESRDALELKFDLFEPTYIVPGFELVENQADSSSLVYIYFDRSTQESRDSTASRLYTVKIQKATPDPKPTAYGGEVLSVRNIGSSTISVSGTLSQSEADKVSSSVKAVKSQDIKFHSDWASARSL